MFSLRLQKPFAYYMLCTALVFFCAEIAFVSACFAVSTDGLRNFLSLWFMFGGLLGAGFIIGDEVLLLHREGRI